MKMDKVEYNKNTLTSQQYGKNASKKNVYNLKIEKNNNDNLFSVDQK